MLFRNIIFCSALFIGCFSLSQDAYAYELNPMVMELRPSGQGSAATGSIRNTHSEPIVIEIEVFKRIQKPDGSDELVLETNDLIVTPPQMVIRPGESQAFRVQWVGDPAPTQELAYRIVSNQLPIRFKEVKRNDFSAEVTMRYRYEAALYIQPNGTQPSAKLDHVRVLDTAEGRMIELTISSNGTRRAILDRPSLELSAGGSSVNLEGEDVEALIGLNILPGSTRVVRLPAPAQLPLGEVAGILKTSYLTVR